MFILIECIINHEPSEDTRAAVKELNEVMRSLFPMVPRLSKMHWARQFHGPARGISDSVDWQSYEEGRPIRLNQMENSPAISGPRVSQRHNQQAIGEQATFQGAFKPDQVSNENKPLSSSILESGFPLAISPSMMTISQAGVTASPGSFGMFEIENENQFMHHNSQIPKLDDERTTSDEDGQVILKDDRFVDKSRKAMAKLLHRRQPIQYNEANNKLIGMLLAKIKDNNALDHENKGKQEATTPSLGKRGPECMRRCIQRGQLHPVQCHSLC